MSRSIFGWDLPPGCTQRHIDEAAGVGAMCECCGHVAEDCICPVCPHCGETGNPKCYSEGHASGIGKEPWKLVPMEYSREQRIGQAKARIAELEAQLADEQYFLGVMEAWEATEATENREIDGEQK